MSEDLFPAAVPVFPLPNCVLFPKVLLPLRIFEPRYKAMFRHVVDSRGGWLAMGLLQSDRERDAAGNPDVFPVAGLGRLVDYQKAADGTYKIVLVGEHRVRLKDWQQVEPFAICAIEKFPVVEPDLPLRDGVRGRLRERLKRLVPRRVDSQALMLLDQSIAEHEEIGPLLDSIAYHFLASPREKQRLLETADAVARERLLLEILERQGPGGAPAPP